jgi:hypothetical protein
MPTIIRVAAATLGIALSACGGNPTEGSAPAGSRELDVSDPAIAPTPTASCVYVALSATEWQTRVDWSRYPVKSIEFFQGTLGGGSATETLARVQRRGTRFLTLGFPPSFARLRDRHQQPLALLTCVQST